MAAARGRTISTLHTVFLELCKYRLQLVLCGFSFWLTTLQDPSKLWVDERITLRMLDRYSPVEIITLFPLHQPHYPTWYLFADLASPIVARWLSMLALPFIVLATIGAAKELGLDNRGVQVAGGAVALSPFLVSQATWLRMYAPLTALLTLGLYFAYKQAHKAAAVSFLAANIVHPFGFFGVIWFVLWRVRSSDWEIAALTAIVGSIPPVLYALANFVLFQSGVSGETSGVTHAIPPEISHVLLVVPASLAGSPHRIAQVALAASLLAVLAINVGRTDSGLWLWILLPIVGIGVASYTVQPVFRLKYFSLISPAVALLAGSTPRRYQQRALVVVLLLGLYLIGWQQQLLGASMARRLTFWF